MKNLFVVAVSISISLTFLSAKSQSTASLKFIDNIQLTPGANQGEKITTVDKQPVKKIYTAAAASSGSIEKCTALQFKYAMLTDREVESITNTKLYDFIDNWMATRYRYGGTSQDGIDCSAFSSTLVSNVYGQNIPRTAKDQYSSCSKISKDDLQEGDLVFFNTRGGVSHVGVYLGNGYFVHSSTHDGVTINSIISDDYYNRKFIGGGRVVN